MMLHFGSALMAAAIVLVAQPSAAADINVGKGQPYATLAAAVSSAKAGDRILLEAGTYIDDTAITSVPLTIEGLEGGAVLTITKPIGNRKAIIVTNASLTVRNITFTGARVTVADGNNGAGIRGQSGDLTIENCTFDTNQDGILVNAIPGAVVTVMRSTFIDNGAGDGFSHALYVNEVAHLTISDSRFAGTKVGHHIKSRALKTLISNTVLDDGAFGTASYSVDLPNGGVAVLDGLQIIQGPKGANATMVAYGAEGKLKAVNALTVTNSTFVDQLRTSQVTAVHNFAADVAAELINNVFQNVPVPLRGRGQVQVGAAPSVSLRAAAIFSSNQADAQSFFRFYNSGTTSGTVTVLLYDVVSGALLTSWISPSIPPGAAPQVAISTIESDATAAFNIPPFYSLALRSSINGSFQHILYRPAHATLTNLSTCDTGTPAAPSRVTNVHSSLLNDSFPSSVVIYNTGVAAASAVLRVSAASDGSNLGVYTTAMIPPSGQFMLEMAVIEQALGFSPSPNLYHYNVKIENAFTGLLQHLVNNNGIGLTVDMTTVCNLARS
jgi:hypothetical protein